MPSYGGLSKGAERRRHRGLAEVAGDVRMNFFMDVVVTFQGTPSDTPSNRPTEQTDCLFMRLTHNRSRNAWYSFKVEGDESPGKMFRHCLVALQCV